MGGMSALPHDGVRAYLDHAATAPLRPEVAEAMAPYRTGRPVNPSGSHRAARAAKQALEEAREMVAAFVGAEPSEVRFVSGGTEADNLAVSGVVGAIAARQAADATAGGLLVVASSSVEHPAVRETCRWLSGAPPTGTIVRHVELPVDPNGALCLDAARQLLGPEVALVSVMAANNETGVVQPLEPLAAIVAEQAPDARLHTDAVQAAPWLDLREVAACADLVSISAHKLGGPVGVGALVARRGTVLAAVLHGGQQEGGLRAGTQDVAGAVGLAAATVAAARDRAADGERVRALRDGLARRLADAVEGFHLCAPLDAALPGHLFFRIDHVDQEEMLVLLDQAGVCASAGSACASGALEPSHVLLAMGVEARQARTAIRFSLGYSTTPEECAWAAESVASAAARLGAAAP